MHDLTSYHCMALDHAVDLHRESFGGDTDANQRLLATATAIRDWLTGPIALLITIGPITDQTTGEIAGATPIGGTVQLTETQQVDLTVTVASAKGTGIPDRPGDVTDDLLWVIGDESVAALQVSEDTRICTVVAGVAGSTDLTVSLGELSARLAVEVLPGGAAVITIGEGTPIERGAGEPEPSPEPV